MREPDVIRVAVKTEKEVTAKGADLGIHIRGSSFVSGRAALRKSKEVAQLVEDLERSGVEAHSIELMSVELEQSTGALTRSSSARYLLRVRCDDPERLGEVMGVIARQKNARLYSIDWRYPDLDAERNRWLEEEVPKANERARLMAKSLGVKLLGIRRASDTLKLIEPAAHRVGFLALESLALTRSVGPEPAALEIPSAHSAKAEYSVDAEYRVSGFENT